MLLQVLNVCVVYLYFLFFGCSLSLDLSWCYLLFNVILFLIKTLNRMDFSGHLISRNVILNENVRGFNLNAASQSYANLMP